MIEHHVVYQRVMEYVKEFTIHTESALYVIEISRQLPEGRTDTKLAETRHFIKRRGYG